MSRRNVSTAVATSVCGLVASGALLSSPAYAAATTVAAGRLAATTTSATTTASAVTASRAATATAASASTATTRRLAGANRYETAVEVSMASFPDPVAAVFVASGADFADALAAGPAGGSLGGPVLLVPPSGTLPTVVARELDRLDPSDIYLVGGTGAVSTPMAAQVATHGRVTRIAGADRFATAAKLVPFHVYTDGADGGTEGPATAVIANGLSLADGVTAGALASHRRSPVLASPLLLTTATSLPASTREALKGFQEVIIVGGTGAISSAVEREVRAVVPQARFTRLSGADRYATAAAAARFSLPQTPAQDVFLTSGTSLSDSLTVAPVVSPASVRYALLPTRKDCVPAVILAEVNRLQPPRRTAVGGTGVVTDAALALKPC